MTLDAYLSEWASDSKLSPDALDADACAVPMLHAKWYRYYVTERLRFKKLELDWKTLYFHKYEWYSGKMLDEDRKALGWEPNPKLIRLGPDISRHLEADPMVQEHMKSRIVAEETCRFLESVLGHLNKRGFDIKNAIDFLKFKMGA